MSQFTIVLRGRVSDARQAMNTARQAGHDHEIHLHTARLQDLLEMAATNGVDTTGWIDPADLEVAAYND